MVVTTARQKILTYLRKARVATAREIARGLNTTAANVRHHLGVLSADGRAEVVAQRRRGGRGRPEKVFALSAAVVGDNLVVLADALLSGPADLQRAGRQLAESGDLIGAAGEPPARRLSRLVDGLNAMNYEARWEAGPDGPRLIFGRCPYARLIAAHPELCKMDAAMLEAALGRPAQAVAKSDPTMPGVCPFAFLLA